MACNSFNKIFCGSICNQQNQKAMFVKCGKSYIRLYHLVNNKYTESDPFTNHKVPGKSITNLPKLKKTPLLYQENFGKQKWRYEKSQTQQYSKGIMSRYKGQSNSVESSASKSSFGGTSSRPSGSTLYRKFHNHHTSYGLSRIKSLNNMSLQSVKKTSKGMTHQFNAPSKVPYFSFITQDLMKTDNGELTRFKTVRSVKYAPSIEKERKNLRKKLSDTGTSGLRDAYIGKKFFHREPKAESITKHLLDLQYFDKKKKNKQTGVKKHKNIETSQTSQTKLNSIRFGQNTEKHPLQRYLPNPLDIPFVNTIQLQSRNLSVKTRSSGKYKLKRDGITEDVNQMEIRHQMAHVAFVVENPNDYEQKHASGKNYSHR